MTEADMALQPRLSLCWGSMEGVPLEDFLVAAANAGFDAVTLNSALQQDARALGWSDAQLGRRVAELGLFVSDIDPLFNWLPSAVSLDGDDPISVCTRASAEDVFQLAHAVGTDLVNAPLGMATPASEQEIVDGFAKLCERAAAEGLRVSLEFMPFNEVATLEVAARIVTQAGQANGGIMFDCWHHERGGGDAAAIGALPPGQIIAVQLDDALPAPMADMLEETLNHRLLPGEGAIDLAATVQHLHDNNPRLVYDVEVFKDELRALSPTARAGQLYNSARQLLSGALGP